MRRIALSALLLAAGVLSALPASSATPTVGGVKKASMSYAFTTTGPQAHFLTETIGTTPVDKEPLDEANPQCVKPRCYAFPFAVAPLTKTAKSVAVSSQITWTSPTSRFWLYVVDVTKHPTSVASCYSYYAAAGTSATVEARLPLKKKYAIWVTAQQVVTPTESVKGSLKAPGTHKPVASPVKTVQDPSGIGIGPAACQG